MLERAFLRPIAHGGLHDATSGVIENSAAAAAAAVAAGYGIECDVRPAAGGVPVVFHDATTRRLMDEDRPVAGLTAEDLRRLRYRGADERILRLDEVCEVIAGAVPLLVEVKGDWGAPDRAFLRQVAQTLGHYAGPVGVMSFEPAIVAALRELAPGVPRGLVAGDYLAHGWAAGRLDATQRHKLTHLLEAPGAAPDFLAFHVEDLPSPVTRFVHEVLGWPLFAWTVRTPRHWEIVRDWADAAIFEGPVPAADQSRT